MIHFSETLPTADRWKVSRVINDLCPTHWKAVRLGDVATVQNGFPFESRFFNDSDGFPLIRIRDVGAPDTKTYYAGPVDPAFVIHPGDILVGMDGEFRCARWSGRPALLNQRVCRITRASAHMDDDFFFLLLQTYLSAVEAVTSSVTVRHLSSKTVEDLELALPPLSEQRRIAEQHATLIARSKRARGAIETIGPLLEQFRRSVLAAAFRGDLTADWRAENASEVALEGNQQRFAHEREAMATAVGVRKRSSASQAPQPVAGFSIPLGWGWHSFDELAASLRSGTVATSLRVRTEHPVLRSSAVRPGVIDYSDCNYLGERDAQAADVLANDDLLITRLSGSVEYVGNCAVVTGIGNQRIYYPDRLFCAKLIPSAYPPYVALAFQCRPFRKALEEAAKSSAGHQRISLSDLRAFTLPVPTRDEQEEIVKRVAERMRSIEGVAEACASARGQLEVLERSLLAKAFRGELVPQDPEDEPASVLLERIRAERERAGARKPARRGQKARTGV